MLHQPCTAILYRADGQASSRIRHSKVANLRDPLTAVGQIRPMRGRFWDFDNMRFGGAVSFQSIARMGVFTLVLLGVGSRANADEFYSARITECNEEHGYATLRTELIAEDYEIFLQLLETRADIVDESDGLTHSWRCDLGHNRSVTVKYRFDASHSGMCGAALRGALSVWENGIKIVGPVSFGAGCGGPDVQSVLVDGGGLEVCEATMGMSASCVTTRREDFPTALDPNFTPGRALGEPIVEAAPRPMRLLAGAGDPFCAFLAARFADNPNGPLDDISAEPAWTVVPSDFQNDHTLSYAVTDVDNDHQPDTILKWAYESHMSGGDRLYVVPENAEIPADAVSLGAFLREVWRRSGNTKELRELVPDAVMRRSGIFSAHFNLMLIRDQSETAILVRVQYEEYAGLSEAEKDSVTRAVLLGRPDGEIEVRCRFGPEFQPGSQL